MFHRHLPLTTLLIVFLLATGCSGGDGAVTDPVTPGIAGNTIAQTVQQPHLWGYYEVEIDPVTMNVSVVPVRHVMFTANMVNIMNSNPAYLGFDIQEVIMESEYMDIDVNVSLAHPFPGMNQFDGYDVRGIFIGDGSGILEHNNDLIYPVTGTDQFMLNDPDDGDGGGPDGYTRWFNPTEFDPLISTMPLFAYTSGIYASSGNDGTATLNPYRYFADEIALDEDVFDWLTYSYELDGRFSAGSSSTRNYYLRFPTSKGVWFNYAITANWEGPDTHPSNTPEAVGCQADVTESLFFVDETNWGGKLIVDLGIFDWGSEIEDGYMQDYNVIIESTVLDGEYILDMTEMTPVGGTEQYSTYHFEVDPDNVDSLDGQEMFVLVEYPDLDYQNEFGVPNLAHTDSLTAVFRYDLVIAPEPTNLAPVCELVIDPSTPMPAEGWDVGVPVTLDATASYDEDLDPLTFEWDFDGDLIYDEDPDDLYEGAPDFPTRKYTESYVGKVFLRLTDGQGGETICDVDVDVTTHQSKNIPLRDGELAYDVGVDETTGDLWVLFEDYEAWIYTRESFYESGSLTFSMPANFYPQYMDVAGTGYNVFGFDTRYKIFSSAGTQTHSGVLDGGPVRDVASHISGDGTFADSLSILLGTTKYPDPDPAYVRHYWHIIQPPDYVYDYYTSWCGYNYFVSDGNTGPEKTYYEWIKAIDTDIDGESLWIIEQPDYYCSKWFKSSFLMTYSGEYFGDGTDSSWVDLRDMSRDSSNRFLVLDFDDGAPLIRVYTGDSDGGSYIGDFGDAESISLDPRRIDGSDYEDAAVVLHGDPDTPGSTYMISVFLVEEMPD